MPIPRDAYKALEHIVGPENISDDPGILESYAFDPWNCQFFQDLYTPRAGAIVLPGSTEEVQAIVKTCNKYKIKFACHSTGWGPWGMAISDDTITLDLRRMNRILEINEKDCYVVVEPYVSWAQLQAELMKRGFNTSPIEAGAQCSALASVTSFAGMGSKSVYMSYNARNFLAAEWVTPTGDIIRLGSLGSGAGWFTADGPGPSLRGVMRGTTGHSGGLGVFTKAAIKIHHWPWKGYFPIEGLSPTFMPVLPKNVRTYVLEWPTFEQWAEGQRKLGEAEILAEAMRSNVSTAVAYIMRSNEEFAKIYPSMKAIITGQCSLVVIEADSEKEFEYKEKVLKKIMEETGGEISILFTEEWMQRTVTGGVIRCDGPTRAVYRPATFCSSFFPFDSVDATRIVVDEGAKIKGKYIGRRTFMDDGAENAWGILYDQGHMCHLEELFLFDPAEPESYRDAVPYTFDTIEALIKWPIPSFLFTVGPFSEIYGPYMLNFHRYLNKIKKVFDPNRVAFSTIYVRGEE